MYKGFVILLEMKANEMCFDDLMTLDINDSVLDQDISNMMLHDEILIFIFNLIQESINVMN